MAELYIDKKRPDQGKIDLHGFHPHDDDLYQTIEDAVREARGAKLRELTIVHGHGHNRVSYGRQFVNSNTGWLGQTVRGVLRHRPELREWMFAKFDCSHDGSTTVRLRGHSRTTLPR